MKEVILKIGAAGEEFDGLNMIKWKIFDWNRLLLIIILLKNSQLFSMETICNKVILQICVIVI